MASVLKVDKLDPQGGTALEIGTSGDTITVPTGAGLTVVDEVKTNKISPSSGVAFTLGDSGDTFTIPSGATITNSGTATGFGGGKVVQYVITTNSAEGSNGTSTYATTGLEQAITPTDANNRIFIQCYNTFKAEGDGSSASGRVGKYSIFKDTSQMDDIQTNVGQNMVSASATATPQIFGTATLFGTEIAGSTSARTYKMMVKTNGTAIVAFNESGYDSCMIVWELEV